MAIALSCPRCGRRRAVEQRQADFGIRCTRCPEFMDVERSRRPGRKRERVREVARRWTPWQILAASLLFVVVCLVSLGMDIGVIKLMIFLAEGLP